MRCRTFLVSGFCMLPSSLLCRAKEKGVMVPVVRVDINADNCLDIIVTSFDGTLRAYDGDNFKLLWQYMDAEGETYT